MKAAKYFALILGIILSLVGCGKFKEIGNDAPAGKIVAISTFKGNCDALVLESVQDSFVDVFFNSTNAKPVKSASGDIVINGLVTIEEGQTGKSSGMLIGGRGGLGGGQSGSSAAGYYMSGITVQAYRNGELIATISIGQNLGKGVLMSPVTMATKAANLISTDLVRKNIIGRK